MKAAPAPALIAFSFVSTVFAQSGNLILSSTSESVRLPRGTTRSVNVSVSVSGASNVGVSIVATAQSGGNWLSLSRSSLTAGSSATSFGFTVNATNLNAGSYVGTVTLSCISGVTCAAATVSILAIVPGASALQPGATLISLSSPSLLQARTAVFSTDGSSLAFTASVTQGGSWLQVTPSANVTPSNLVITATPGSLAAGTYTGTVLLTAANGTMPVPIQVTLTLLTSGGSGGGSGFNISVSPSTLEIWTVSQKKVVNFPLVKATGTGTASLSINATTSNGKPWLAASLSAQTITGGGNPVTVTITADPKAVPPPDSLPASFTGTVTISASPGNTVTIAVTLTLYSGSDVTLSPDPVQFTLVPGQKLAQPVTLTVANPGSPITYDTFVNVPPASWLSATANGATITILVDATGLAPDTYASSVKIVGSSGSPITAIVHVTATVGGTTGFTFSADRQSLSFPLSAGAAAAQTTVNLSASTPTSFTAAVTSGNNWLQVSSTATAIPAPLIVTATPGSLQPGTYTGNVRVTANGTTVDIAATMTLTATAALSIDTTPIALTTQVGGGCTGKNVSILSSSNGIVLPYTAQVSVQSPAGGNWLTLGSAGGNTPGGISVSCNSAGLSAGNYAGLVTIASASATNTPVTIPVTLNVGVGTGINASPSSASLSLTAGGTCNSQVISVSSTSPASGVAWSATSTVTAGSNWMTVSPPSGSTPGSLTISCNAAGLKAGLYTGNVKLTSATASTTVNVNLSVSDLTVSSAASGDSRLAAGMIAALFGSGLAPSIVIVSPPNTSAAGITLTVRDSAGGSLSAPLFFVSPAQINFAIPEATAAGAATITVNGPSGALATANVQIFNVAPGIFTMTGLPAGPAAALAAFYDSNGQPLGPADAFRCTPAGCSTFPLDVNGGPQLVVSLYGTGFHRATNFSVRAGPTNATVLGVAASPQFIGEDQMNILIPKSLAGTGDVVVTITADGVTSNGPHLNFR